MITALNILTALLLIAASVPLIQRRVRPNSVYGFRTPKTLGDEQVWYEANAFSGRMLLRAGAVTLVGTVILAFVPLPLAAKALADAAVTLVSVLWALIVSFAYLQKL